MEQSLGFESPSVLSEKAPRFRRKRYYLVQERAEDRSERIRLKDLRSQLPVDEIRHHQLSHLPQEPRFIRVEGEYYPDLLQEPGIYFVSEPFGDYLTAKLAVQNILYNRVSMVTEGSRYAAEYVLLIVPEVDCVNEASIRYARDGSIAYLEIDDERTEGYPIFRIKGLPGLIVTGKLDWRPFAGVACIPLERYFDYQGERNRFSRDRASGKRLAELEKAFEKKADKSGETFYMMGVRQKLNRYALRQAIGQGVKTIFDNYQGQTGPPDVLTLSFSWETARIGVAGNPASQLETASFPLNLAEVKAYLQKTPPQLAGQLHKIGWEIVVQELINALKIVEKYPTIHGGQPFRIYVEDPDNPTGMPQLVYNHQTPFQHQLENETSLQRLDFTAQDLSECDLSGKDLTGNGLRNVNLRGANLAGSTLKGTEFRECQLTAAQFQSGNLQAAKFRECLAVRANFDGANLRDAEISGGNFNHIHCVKTNLAGARIKTSRLYRADYYKANLSGAQFEIPGSMRKNGFQLCDLRNARFIGDPDDSDSIMGQNDFRNANLSGAKFEFNQLTEVNFTKARLYGVDFSGCRRMSACQFEWSQSGELHFGSLTIYQSDFTGVDLSRLKLSKGCGLVGNNFYFANLSRLDLTTCDEFSENQLILTNLSNANLSGLDFTTCNVRRANFNGANLKAAKFTETQLRYLELSAGQRREIIVVVAADEENEE